jgi:hypothetical protein
VGAWSGVVLTVIHSCLRLVHGLRGEALITSPRLLLEKVTGPPDREADIQSEHEVVIALHPGLTTIGFH